MQNRTLQPTSWLAKRLGLSISTVERLRAQGSPDLPPYITIGGSIRYSDVDVEAWIADRLKAGQQQPSITQERASDA